MSQDDGPATHLSLTVLSVMLRWLSILLIAPAATVGVTVLMDRELHGCLFLLESDQRAFPGTGRHSPHTNASKFRLKRAKKRIKFGGFCRILEEPAPPLASKLIRDIPQYFMEGLTVLGGWMGQTSIFGRSTHDQRTIPS